MLLTPSETKVRNRLVEAINHGMDEGFHELAVQADELQGNHQDGAPTHRGRRASTQVQAPSETAGVGRHVKFGRTGPRLEGSSARTVGRRRKPQGRVTFRAAKVKAQKIKNSSGVVFPPSSACRAAWYGDTCRRNGCQ